MINVSNMVIALVFGCLVGSIIWYFGIQLLYGLVLAIMMVLYAFVTPIYWFAEFIHRVIIFLRRHVLIYLEERMQ